MLSTAHRTLGATFLALSATLAPAQQTRADVIAQRDEAQARGQLGVLFGEDSGSTFITSHFHSSESREAVKGELDRAIMAGTLTVLVRGDSGSVYISRHQVLRTPRSEVRDALATAEKDHSLEKLYGEDSGSFELSQHRRGAQGGAQAVSREWLKSQNSEHL